MLNKHKLKEKIEDLNMVIEMRCQSYDIFRCHEAELPDGRIIIKPGHKPGYKNFKKVFTEDVEIFYEVLPEPSIIRKDLERKMKKGGYYRVLLALSSSDDPEEDVLFVDDLTKECLIKDGILVEEKPQDTYSLFEGRHNLPENRGYLFSDFNFNSFNGVKTDFYHEALDRIIKGEEIKIIVTGLTPALCEFINDVIKYHKSVILLHYNRDTDEYVSQKIGE